MKHNANAYKDGCRCDTCRYDVAREYNLYKLRVMANGGEPLTIDKRGAVRRLQALMASGWPRRVLARLAGYEGDAFGPVLNGKRQRITIDTLQRIDELYERLSMTPGPSSRARAAAARKGWPRPLQWDDIDHDTHPAGTYERAPRRDSIDPVRVHRILNLRDMTLASEATYAERIAVVAGWPGSLCELEELTGWRTDRYKAGAA